MSDTNNNFAKKLNLAFELEEELVKLYQSFKIDLEKSQGNNENVLPIPATYVIDKDKKIVSAWVDVDYKKRAEPDDVINEYNKLIASL